MASWLNLKSLFGWISTIKCSNYHSCRSHIFGHVFEFVFDNGITHLLHKKSLFCSGHRLSEGFSFSEDTVFLAPDASIPWPRVFETGLPFRPHTRRRKGGRQPNFDATDQVFVRVPCEVARQGGYSPPLPPRFCITMAFCCITQSSQVQQVHMHVRL
jgi:hypothetical protein